MAQEKVQPPHLELSFTQKCEHMCIGICGASATAAGDSTVVQPHIFEDRVLKPLIGRDLKPSMITLTGGSIGMVEHRKLLHEYLDLLSKHEIPIKLSTTLVWENESFWKNMKNYDVRRIHTSYRDLTPELTEAQARFPGTGPMVLKNLQRIQEHLPHVFVEVETLISTTLTPHLPEIGTTIARTMSAGNSWEWQLQTLKASGNADSLSLAVLGGDLVTSLSFLDNHNYLSQFGQRQIKLLCMPPVCDKLAGQKVQSIIDSSGGVVYTSRCTEGQVSTDPGTSSGVVYLSGETRSDGNPALYMRPCFIVNPPPETPLPDLLQVDVTEAYLHHPFLASWRNPDLVPSECGICDVPHDSFDVQHSHNCIPNCRASACSLQTTGLLEQDLKRFPPQVEIQYRSSNLQ